MTAIDTTTNAVIAEVPIGQAPQAIAYVPNAVPEGDGAGGLQPLGLAGQATHLTLVAANGGNGEAPTSVSLFDQGLLQILEASVTGLEPRKPYVLVLSDRADGGGAVEPLASFVTNPAGSAIVNAAGPIRQIVRGDAEAPRRYLAIVAGAPAKLGAPVQVQAE